MNVNNLQQRTNFTAGSERFPLVPFYLTSVNIPGMNFNIAEEGGRGGARIKMGSDSITYNTLSFEMLIDEDFQIYFAFMDEIRNSISIESSQYADRDFDFWIEMSDSKGHYVWRMEFKNCRIESISDINLDTTDDGTENTMSIELNYDYYEVINGFQTVPTLRTS